MNGSNRSLRRETQGAMMTIAAGQDPRRFLDPAVLFRLGRLELRARQAVEGFLSGLHKSPFFGHSVEFVQHREYVTGDDIRHLDWKVWSKTDRFYIKQFEAETNLRCQMLVDCSESMAYGREGMDKRSYACTAAASAAWLLLRQQDSVGLVTFDKAARRMVPARNVSMHLDAIVNALDGSMPGEGTDLGTVCRRVASSIHGRGMVAVFSDLLTDREALMRALRMFRQRKQEVLVFHILDTDELNFPFSGVTRFEGMEALPDLLCDPEALREGYLRELNTFLQDVRQGCARLGVDYQLIPTNQPLDAVLSRFLHRRDAFAGGRASIS